jgi:hypothetical protein
MADQSGTQKRRPRGANGSAPTLQRGVRGTAVIALQLRLIELGYKAGAADGDFGPSTERAVIRAWSMSTWGAPRIVRVDAGQLLAQAQGSEQVQRLEIADGGMQSWRLATSDINFDGFADLYVITSAGTANAYARYWRFVADRDSYEDLGIFLSSSAMPRASA